MNEAEKNIKALDAAIDSIKKIEKVIAYCKKELEKSDESDYGAGIADACDNVLTILGEGI